ncbi:SdrD B-like domain-containing protein [Paenibacillus sp. CAU 1782]
MGISGAPLGSKDTLVRKSIALALALMMVLQTAQLAGVIQHSSAAGATVPDSIMKQTLLLNGPRLGSAEEILDYFSSPATGSKTLAYFDTNGAILGYPNDFEAQLGQSSYPFTLLYEWEIDPTIATQGGDYTFSLPASLKLERDLSGSLGNAGTFTVNRASKQVTLNFAAQNVAAPEDLYLRGGLQIETLLEETTVITDNELIIEIPVNASNTVTVNLPVKWNGANPTITKDLDRSKGTNNSGLDRLVNTSRVYWTMDVNTKLSTIDKPVIIDTLPEELEYISLEVYPLTVNLQGNVSQGATALDPATEYSVLYTPSVPDAPGVPGTPGTIAIELAQSHQPTSKAYRILVTTGVKGTADITQDGKSLTNYIALLDDASQIATSSASVTVKRGPLTKKTKGSYTSDTNGAGDNQTVNWTLDYNFGQIQMDDPVITDILPVGHELVPGSLRVTKVGVADNGSATDPRDPVAAGNGADQYALAETKALAVDAFTVADQFALTLNGTIDSAYVIEYATRSKDIVPITANNNKTNTFSSSFDPGKSSSESHQYVQRVIDKSGQLTNYASKKISWTIDLNSNNYWFKGTASEPLKLVDTFNRLGLSLDAGSLVITNRSGTPLTEGNEYSLSPTVNVENKETGFVITFNNNYDFNQKHTVTYTTTFDYELYASSNPWNSTNNNTFQNSGEFYWEQIVDKATGTTELQGSGSQRDSDTITPNSNTLHNGYKNGSYDARTKEITWNVLFNYHNESVDDARLVDILQSGQEYVANSLQIRSMSLAANGNLNNGAIVPAANYDLGYTPGSGNTNGQLQVDFKNTINGPHLVTFKTTLRGKLVPDIVHNTATFSSSNNLFRATLSASVSPSFGDTFVDKEISQPAGANGWKLAEWTIWINPGMSQLSNIKLEDRPDQYQTLLPDTFKLFEAEPNTANPNDSGAPRDADFTLIEVPIDNVNYKLTFSNDTSAPFNPMFTLEVLNPQTTEKAYKLVYRTLLADGVGNSTSNSYAFSATEKSVTRNHAQETHGIIKSNGDGFSFPGSNNYRGGVTLKKVAADKLDELLAGAEFTLRAKHGSFTQTLTTDNNGSITFSDVPFGQYELVEKTAPTGYQLDTTPINVVINTTTDVELTVENVIGSGRIGDYVWWDKNRNGLQDADEDGVSGITVRLFKEGDPDTAIATTTTDNDGKYLFDNLEPGDYYVQFQWPQDYELTRNVSGSPGEDSNPLDNNRKTDKITIDRSNNFQDLTIDLGLVPRGAIGDYVWLDWDIDGRQDTHAKERGLNGIEVVLYKEVGGAAVEVERATTGNYPAGHAKAGEPGYYWFDQLLGGKYWVEFLLPVSYNPTTEGVGTNTQDSNPTTDEGTTADSRTKYRTGEINIGPANWVDPTIDFGVVALGKIGDYVWFDSNDNGIQETGEPGIQGIEVKLYKDNGASRELVDTVYTDLDGKYLFEHLEAGNYYVWFQTPSIYDLAKMESAGSNSGNDSNRIHASGTDKGLTVNPIPIGPSGWEDLSIDLGFTGKGAIGDYVWHDRNWNGIQDEGPEHGINGVKVYLYRDTPTGTPYKTDVTKTVDGRPGYYNFKELPQGTYYVKFEYPEEYAKTVAESDNDAPNGSNWTDNDHITRAIHIGENETPYGWVNPSIDLGLVAKGVIGNYVWLDRNRNGIQDEDASEGLNGITVKLFKNGTTGTAYAETVTANGPDGKPGYYLFDNLASGNYYVQVVFDENYEVTLAEQGSGAGADELDSNATHGNGFTDVIRIGETAPRGWEDLTIDFGLVRKGAIGDYTWLDVNYNGKQDEEDVRGMNGVTVKLFDSDKKLIAQTITADKNGKPGYYLFDHLFAGDYYVTFTAPTGYLTTKAGATGVAADEDSNPILGGYTEVITIGSGTVWRDMTIDQGYYFVVYPPIFPTPTPTPTPGTEEPGETPTPGEPTPTPGAPTPTPTPGVTPAPTPTTGPTPTPVTEKTDEETPVGGTVEVPSEGTTEIGTPPANGGITITPDGKWTYTPKPGFVGKDKFSIIVVDKDGNEEEIWFEIDVDPIPEGGTDSSPDGVNTLPKTGQESYLLFYLLGSILVVGGIALRLARNRKTS